MRKKKNEQFDLEEYNKEKPKKSVKKTSKYTVLLIPDSTDHSKTFELTFDHILRAIVVIIAIGIVLVSLLISSGIKIFRLQNDDSDKKVIDELNAQIEKLNGEKAEMYDQIVYLTKLVAEKQEKEKSITEEMAAQAMPTGYPIEGIALMIQDPTAEGGVTAGRVVFNTIIGTAVVASGDGVVTDITDNEIFGKTVVIDHENGYQSVYRCQGSVKVASGDEVSRSEVLFVITEEDSLFAYEVLKNGMAVEPLDIMDLNG